MELTSKEKAKDLVEKAYKTTGLYTNDVKIALLCVNEILKELKWINNYEDKDRIIYWQKVKEELETF